MTAKEIAGPTRRCAATGRELLPGEAFMASLTLTPDGYCRADYAESAWPGPPHNCVAYWPGKVPASPAAKMPSYPESTLAEWFAQLSTDADPAKAHLRYVVALLLMRKKRLKFEDSKPTEAGRVMLLRDAKTGARYEVSDPELGASELADAEAEVGRVLGWNTTE